MIRLVRAGLRLLDAALEGDDALAEALGHDVVTGWITFTEALQPTAPPWRPRATTPAGVPASS